jgi:hypothetical protein
MGELLQVSMIAVEQNFLCVMRAADPAMISAETESVSSDWTRSTV